MCHGGLSRMNIFKVLFLSLFLAGCTQVKQIQNLDPLLTLKAYSDEKDGQEKWVNEEAKRFDNLLKAVMSDSIDPASTKDSILQNYGEPVVIDHFKEHNSIVERWLYRHPIQKLASDRIYFYFDANGNLLRHDHVVPSIDGQS